MATNPANAAATADAVEHDVQHHPGWQTYVVIGLILTIITAVEVAVFYIPAMHPVMVPVLLVLSATKFILVIMFYMHLKFDSKLFSTLFVGPLLLAMSAVIGLIILFRVLPLYNP